MKPESWSKLAFFTSIAALVLAGVVFMRIIQPNYTLTVDSFGHPWRIENYSGRVWVGGLDSTTGKTVWKELPAESPP